VKRPRVLLSARDPGGAAQVRAVLPALRADGRLDVHLAASGPAWDMLSAAGEGPIRFALPDGSTHVPPNGDPAPLLRAADALLARVDPDALVVGISSLGVGLDEALLHRGADRPTFALQDYPGDANAIEGAFARVYFVRDEAAARLTRARFPVTAIPVGSLRHEAYAALDVPALRAATRARIGAAPGTPVVGFFGQPADIPGHEAAFHHLVAALASRPVKPLVILREHPKSTGHRRSHLAALERAGVAIHDASDEAAAEPWLAACDVVVTCFSHCTMDYAFLAARSPEPLGSAVFLLTTPEVQGFIRDYAGIEQPDGVALGLGRVARAPAEVPAALDAALTAGERRAFHEASRRLPRQARLDRVVAEVARAAAARAARARVPR
jgi:hypothetical protein